MSTFSDFYPGLSPRAVNRRFPLATTVFWLTSYEIKTTKKEKQNHHGGQFSVRMFNLRSICPRKVCLTLTRFARCVLSFFKPVKGIRVKTVTAYILSKLNNISDKNVYCDVKYMK